MEQNGSGNQNGQGNYQGINNAPDNPYTEYYQQYIVTPEQKKKEVSKPKRVGSMILCALSDMFMLSFSVMWAVFSYQEISGFRDSDMTVSNFIAATVMIFFYFMITCLPVSIIAKVLNPKSKWPVINFVSMFVLLAVMITLSFFIPGWADDQKRSRSEKISEALNSDVEELLKDYSFDVQDFDVDYEYLPDGKYNVWVYVSSEATKRQISEVDELLEGLYGMDSSSEYGITFKVHPVYFEPDDDSRFVFLHTYEFTYRSYSPRPQSADIDDALDSVWEYSPRKQGHVPEELEKGQLLIVVR